jgi:pyruvate,water dikinase
MPPGLLSYMNKNIIIPITSGRAAGLKGLGSKAGNLILMKQKGLPVPPGFCITCFAYTEFLEKNNLTSYIGNILDKIGTAPQKEKVKLLSDIRRSIIKAPITDVLYKEIEGIYLKSGFKKVAVRSSSSAEDLPGHSFAGQYDTYLNISGLPNLIDTVKKCWASLWSQRAYTYREKNGFDHLSVNIAVIIQKFIDADVSGVLFTVDSVGGRPEHLIIESCFGLGSILVSGKITPDRIVVSKKRLHLLSYAVSEKKIKCVPDDAGGVKELNVDRERIKALSLEEPVIRKIARYALKAEKAFASPQDMEWALKGKKIYFLSFLPQTGQW